ncbi:MAG TPA: hypothetical protein VKD45_05830 [Hyphomicrobiaceae bacterium]|nr:hypothetical protein [Hyphomicrobiaceae bacterium]
MSFMIRATAKALALAGVAVALVGCAGEGESFFTTGALGTSAEAKLDPMCVTLATRIETLRKEGVAEKIEKAAAKKYKMTQSDLNKADQLTKANADFQLRCSTVMPKSATIDPAPEPPPPPPPKAKPKAASAASAQPN